VTALRDGLGEPLVELPPETVAEIRAFLDGQSRIRAAAWARHLEPGNGPEVTDHHILLAVDDKDWAIGDMRALDDAIPLPYLGMVGPTWQDFFPVSELPAVRAFATILWEQTVPGRDALDFRYTYEPFQAERDAVERLRDLLASEPAIRRVDAVLEKLWNGESLVDERVQLYVAADLRADALDVAMKAARDSVLDGRSEYGAQLGRPSTDAATLYEAAV
jgi:hypothetical protein